LNGGFGSDSIYNGDSADRIFGQDNNDRLYGEIGNDSIYGGWNDDAFYGGAGDDTLYGDDSTGGAYGNDTLSGDAGNDNLFGGAANDRYIYNFSGGNRDIINDSAGSDTISITGVTSQSQLYFNRGDVAGYSYYDGLIALVSEAGTGTITNYIIIKDVFSGSDTGGRIENLSTPWGTLWLPDWII
jgi:Ca2+-binding RTX toxin-like protein